MVLPLYKVSGPRKFSGAQWSHLLLLLYAGPPCMQKMRHYHPDLLLPRLSDHLSGRSHQSAHPDVQCLRLQKGHIQHLLKFRLPGSGHSFLPGPFHKDADPVYLYRSFLLCGGPRLKTVKGIRWITKTGNIHLSQIIILKIRKKCCYPLKIIVLFLVF